MHEEWTDRLSDYLDDELTADEHAGVAAHLASCAHCAKVAADLERVARQARALVPRPPEADLWPGVDARISRIAQPRRISFTLPQLAAAAAVLIAVSGGAAWEVGMRSADRPAKASRSDNGAGTNATPESEASAERSQAERPAPAEMLNVSPSTPMAAKVSFADAQYDAAVSDLEKTLKSGRTRLDKSTIAIVEHNLQIIDQAIEQARQALEGDPANSYLSGHLVEARRRKLDLLRRAAALTNETD